MGMTREEFKNIVKGMKAIYTDVKFIPDQFAFDMWYVVLQAYSYKTVQLAVGTYIRKGKQPPTPADIIECIDVQDVSNYYPTEQEAWSQVAKACANGNYGYKEEFAKLPALIQKAVDSERNIHEWASVPIDEFQTVIQSNFMRSYRACVKADKEFKKYPEQVKQLVQDKVKMIGAV